MMNANSKAARWVAMDRGYEAEAVVACTNDRAPKAKQLPALPATMALRAAQLGASATRTH